MMIKIRCFYFQKKKGNNCFLTNFLSRISLERKWFGLYETWLLREREKKIDGIILVPRNDFIRREEMKMGLKNIQLCRYYLHIKNVGCQHFSLFLHFKKKNGCTICSSCFTMMGTCPFASIFQWQYFHHFILMS